MNNGNQDNEKWQWVDEDPIEKLLSNRGNGNADSPAALWEPKPEAAVPAPVVEPPVPAASVVVAEEDPEWADAFARALQLQKEEKWEAAAGVFREIVAQDPGRAEPQIGLGVSLLHLDRTVEALQCFENSTSANTDRERSLFGKAVALQKLDRNDEAQAAYRDLLQLTPNNIEALVNLVALSVAMEDGKSLGEYSQKLLDLDPHSKAALQGLATVALWNHDYSSAIGYCKRVVEVDAGCYEGWFNLGFARQHKPLAKRAARSIA